MGLQDWANNGWLKSHKTSREEIGNLLEIVERDLKDAQLIGAAAPLRAKRSVYFHQQPNGVRFAHADARHHWAYVAFNCRLLI